MSNRILSMLLIFAAVVSAYGKGPVDLILISGGGLNQPIEITDPASLHTFDPWIGQFADWKAKPLVDAPCYRRSFEVMFYMKWPGRNSSFDRGDLKMIYATRYCWTGEAGYVYLPGPDEPLYGGNGGTIIRGDADGKWHPATPAWDSLLSSAVTMRDQEATPDKIIISGGELKRPVEITDFGTAQQVRSLDGRVCGLEGPGSNGPLQLGIRSYLFQTRDRSQKGTQTGNALRSGRLQADLRPALLHGQCGRTGLCPPRGLHR